MPPTRRPCSCLIANVVVIRCDAIVIDSGAILLFQKVGGSGDSGGWGSTTYYYYYYTHASFERDKSRMARSEKNDGQNIVNN